MILGKIWVQIINNTKILTKFRFTKSGSDSQPDKYKEKAPAGELPGLSRGV